MPNCFITYWIFRGKAGINMRYLINYADSNYEKTQKLCSKSGFRFGFDKVIEYTEKNIDKDFKIENAEILRQKRGNGLWLWKPYIIKKTIDEINNGDILFYCDSGAFLFRRPDPIFEILRSQDIWVSTLPLIEKQFTKKYAFEAMELLDAKYIDTPQISGSFIAFKKSEFTMNFVNEWLFYCCDKKILEPPKDLDAEIPEFISHREDQSILSLLVKKYNLKVYSDPSQFGRLPEKYSQKGFVMSYYGKEDYKPFIIHHRTSNAKMSVIFRQWLCAVLPRKIGILLIK